jgi:hypothetical protein
MNDKKIPFLLNFKSEIPIIDEDDCEWERTKRRPTNKYTSARRLKSGYTRSGKWKPSRMTKSRMDKRVGY